MQMKLFGLLIALSFAAKQNKNVAEIGEKYGENVNENGEEKSMFVKIEEDECANKNKKESSSQYIGVSYNVNISKWFAQRCSKYEKKTIYNGCYDNEKTAAHASDTLARNFIAKGEQGHKMNFPDDDTEVYPEKTTSSQYIGVNYRENRSTWQAKRRSRHEKKMIYNGTYKDEETAAHASDTLARKLMANSDQNHKLNFPDDYTEVYPEEKTRSSQYIGVFYNMKRSKWYPQRRSKHEKKNVGNGGYENEETAAHASDTLARKLMANGEQRHKLNFLDDDTEVFPERARKRKRPDHEDLNHPKNN